MAKTIRKTIQITTRKRHNGVKINDEFYSYDKNNAQFEFIMDYDVPADKVIALFHFENTNRYYETLCQFKGNLITIEFDTSLIVEDELVTGYLYFDKLEKSTDVYRFTFGARLSEIDKTRELPVEEKVSRRIVPVADIVTKQELEELMDKIKKNGGTYDDTEIRELLSGKADSSDVVTKQELETKGYLTEHQSLEEYAKKTELYNDSALVSRVAALENKTDNDTVYNDTEVKERLTNLENKPHVDLSNLATKEELNEVRNSQPVLDTSNLVTKNELEAKGYLTAHQSLDEYAKKSELPQGLEDRVSLLETKSIANGAYNDKPLLDKIREVEEQFTNASHLYLTSHQSLEHLVTKDELTAKGYLTSHQSLEDYAKKTELYNDSALKARVDALENKAPVDLSHLVTRDELDGKHYLTEHQPLTDYALKSELYNDTALKSRVEALEAKTDNDTLYDDTDVKRRLSAIEDTSVTKQELEEKGYAKKSELYNDSALTERVSLLEAKAIANGAYNDKPLLDKINAIEEQFNRASNLYLTSHQSLEHLVTKDELEGKGYLTSHQDISGLVTKEELASKNYLTEHQSLASLVTKDELEEKGYLTNHQDISGLATNSKVEAVEQRVQVLENKPDVDLSHVVTKDELSDKGYLTTHQDISGLVTKQELEDKHYIQDVSNLATTEKVTAVENRVQALENKSVVTHEELESKHYLVEHQSLDGLVTKEELASKNYLTNHQSLDGYVTKSELEQAGYIKEHQSLTDYAKKSEMAELVTKEELESKGYIQDISGLATKQELEAAKASIPQPYNDTEIREELARKVNTDTLATLATKKELQTNDEEVKRRLTTLEGKTDNFITGVSVNKEGSNVTLTYNYVDGQSKNVSFTDSDTVNVAYDDSGVKARLTNLENRPQVDVTTLVSKAELPQSLENYALKSELYNDSALTQRVSNLENSTVTKQELQSKNYLTEHQSLTNYAKKSELYNDAAIVNRMNVLENGISKLVTNEELEGKNYLTSHQSLEEYAKKVELNNLVTRDELAGKGYLTQHQSLDGYALKTELPTPYNDSALVSRINALEVKTDNDTVYNDTEVKQRLTALESRPTGQSEMRGTGMPNGVVEAPIGATYIDTAKTNGALKWIKTTDGGNQGWKVVEGDTGWVLGWQEDKGKNKNRMYFRRINDVVHVKFEPKISDNVNAHEYNLILDTGGSDIFGQLSIQGFQSVDNIVQTIFKKTIDIPGDTYSAENSEASQGCGAVCLHYVYNNDSKRELELHIVTSQFSSEENHVNPFSYLTEDEWPTTLPTL